VPTPPSSKAVQFELPPGDAATDGSLYSLESSWKSQDGQSLALADLAGKVRVIAMGYSSCQYACPRLVADMRSLREQIEASIPGSVGFVFVSIDPEHDSPEKLKAYAERQQLGSSDDWILLTGDEDSVLELSVLIGMKYRKTDASDFAHSNIISILDRDGRIIHQQFGLGTDREKTIAAIHAAVETGDAP